MDEYAVRFQSMAFAAGELTGRLRWRGSTGSCPLVPEPFSFRLEVDRRGRLGVLARVRLVMAPFAWADVAWLCNPALTAACVAMLALAARRMMPALPAAPGWAMVFAVASPAFLVMGISYYAMTAIMLANLVYIRGFTPAGRRRCSGPESWGRSR